mgnify:CR=1 FL=1
MFLNIRSAVLQQMSMVNFINFYDNNVYAAGKAFANQPQYYKDWAFIFNSDFMKQRRGGIKTDINGTRVKVKTLKFRPYVMAGRVFKEEESLTLWVSADKNKIPLKTQEVNDKNYFRSVQQKNNF